MLRDSSGCDGWARSQQQQFACRTRGARGRSLYTRPLRCITSRSWFSIGLNTSLLVVPMQIRITRHNGLHLGRLLPAMQGVLLHSCAQLLLGQMPVHPTPARTSHPINQQQQYNILLAPFVTSCQCCMCRVCADLTCAGVPLPV